MKKIFFFLTLFSSLAVNAQHTASQPNCCDCVDTAKLETQNYFDGQVSLSVPEKTFTLTKEQLSAKGILPKDSTVKFLVSGDSLRSFKFSISFAKQYGKDTLFNADTLIKLAVSDAPKSNDAFRILLSADKEMINGNEWAVVIFRKSGDVIKNNITFTTFVNHHIFNLGFTYVESEDNICQAKIRKIAKSVKFN